MTYCIRTTAGTYPAATFSEALKFYRDLIRRGRRAAIVDERGRALRWTQPLLLGKENQCQQ